MLTTSEAAVTITIWVLTASGTFFGGRAAWRRRRQRNALKNQQVQHPANDNPDRSPGDGRPDN